MKYRRLGNTGITVSEIGFGGEWLERHDEVESVVFVNRKISQKTIENSVTSFSI